MRPISIHLFVHSTTIGQKQLWKMYGGPDWAKTMNWWILTHNLVRKHERKSIKHQLEAYCEVKVKSQIRVLMGVWD